MKTLFARINLPRLVIAAMVGPLAYGCTAVRAANDSGDLPQAVVKFGDLNISNPAGAATLYRRIYAAAHDVCGSFDTDVRDLSKSANRATCVHNAVRNAVAEVNQPALSAIYNARNPDPLPIAVAAAQYR